MRMVTDDTQEEEDDDEEDEDPDPDDVRVTVCCSVLQCVLASCSVVQWCSVV